MAVELNINGRIEHIDAPPEMPLLWALRDELGLVGTKFGCGAGLCGACTVHLDGAAVRACQTPIGDVGTARIVTIEGIGATDVGARLQQAWLAFDVMQCGYCQAGQIMSAAALLATTPAPGDDDIDSAMAGNLCRCGTYTRIRAAIHKAAERNAAEGSAG
ncbi:(2Fe-2S)-binding protein [Inquilinus limosus]|uniref:(2Fe-2S)-binding protein n=1 Tax=Inquilinus limosus TaxID=171674 RepID=A0A211ZLZ2_9PROT|nr:(2Fe-2S)-binding protein [Inquilinus limosus]OWJ66298.1 (2Fe-2S)-binding protein [Inquilinus limosus]